MFAATLHLIKGPELTGEKTWKFTTTGEWFTGLGGHSYNATVEWIWDGKDLRAEWIHYKKPLKHLPIDIYRGGPGLLVAENFDINADTLKTKKLIIKNSWIKDLDEEWGLYRRMTKEEIIKRTKELKSIHPKKLAIDIYNMLNRRNNNWHFLEKEVIDDGCNAYSFNSLHKIRFPWFGNHSKIEDRVFGNLCITLSNYKGKWHIYSIEGFPSWINNPENIEKDIGSIMRKKFGRADSVEGKEIKTHIYHMGNYQVLKFKIDIKKNKILSVVVEEESKGKKVE